MPSLKDFDSLAEILAKYRDWNPPSDPPVACKICGKYQKLCIL